MTNAFKVGQIVTGIYNTGKYVGEVVEDRNERYLIQVLAVLKHPKQGDLHHPNSVDVPLFHERRALAYKEKANIPKVYVKEYIGEIPDYKESLLEALNELVATYSND